MVLAQWWEKPLAEAMMEYPQLAGHLSGYGFAPMSLALPLVQNLAVCADDFFEDIGLGRDQLLHHLDRLLQTQAGTAALKISRLTLIGGQNKSGQAEDIILDLVPGSITSIVGPTGSGKSRLLADIEWLAAGDTPTHRRILINGDAPDPGLRFSMEHKLVAQLSQNMNFVMDVSVGDFIHMHAASRMIDSDTVVDDILLQANRLSGESFSVDTPVTALSGGQSRALMIADTAFLSASPVVLIDEVENAGIDRKHALQLLARQEKIVLIATHDPILALMAQQRLVIRNGGIAKRIQTSSAELANLEELEALDHWMQSLRHRLRQGDMLEGIH